MRTRRSRRASTAALTGLLAALVLVLGGLGCAHPRCGETGVAVQVLGSGGPIPDDGRASSAYLIWHEGRSRALIDAGGGAFVRFAEAGASLEALDLVALSHMHADHVAGLPALLKGGFFAARTRPLAVAGPTGGGAYPGTREWLELTVGPEGAYRYLDWLLDPGRGSWSLEVHELDHTRRDVGVEVVELDGLKLSAIGVEHGPVPALAYRVELGGRVLVFSGDHNGDSPGFVEFARGADLLVMDHAIGERPDAVAGQLHAKPSEIASIAEAAGVETLVLSHHMARSLAELDSTLELLAVHFEGQVEVADDLSCY